MSLILTVLFMSCITLVTSEEEKESSTVEQNIKNYIQEIEHLAASAEKYRHDKTLPTDITQHLNSKIVETIKDLNNILDNHNNTDVFFKSRGIDRVIVTNIRNTHKPLRAQLLILIKTLFHKEPRDTNALLPMNLVDMLLDVFESDDNLDLKAHSLDILYLWLPKNPKLQARVMRLKGLQPFYEQITKLDATVIYKLLDLFSTILEEHIEARDEDYKENDDRIKYYRMIGLIERMSTPMVCNGLLNIFKESITYGEINKEIFVPIANIIKNVKPFCLTVYKGKVTAKNVFERLKNYYKNSLGTFDNNQLNLTEINLTFDEYNAQLSEGFKDEF